MKLIVIADLLCPFQQDAFSLVVVENSAACACPEDCCSERCPSYWNNSINTEICGIGPDTKNLDPL